LTDALDDADGVPVEDVPEVPAAPAPAGLVFRMNFALLDELLGVLAVPEVPVVPGVLLGEALERSMHPVTVTLSAALELGVCELGGGVVCAATAIAMVHTIAAANPKLFVIVSS
jgi:hypothetical protein